MKRFKNIAKVRKANKAIGHHFFDRKTMGFFNSRIESGLLRGKYFISSEVYARQPRVFTIREALEDGTIKNPRYERYRSKDLALEAIKELED